MNVLLNPQQRVASVMQMHISKYKTDDSSKSSQVSTQTKVLDGTDLVSIVGETQSTEGKPSVSFEGLPNEIKNAKELAVEVFKRYGKFEKGKALLDGKPYSGSITMPPEPNLPFKASFFINSLIHFVTPPKAQLIYENGYLKKSILANGTEKIYERLGDKLDKVMIKNSNNPVNDKTLILSIPKQRTKTVMQTQIAKYKPEDLSKTNQNLTQTKDLDGRDLDSIVGKTKSSDVESNVSIEGMPNEVKNAKELAVEVFKKSGKFEKGMALLDGKPYSGTITTPPKPNYLPFENCFLINSLIHFATPPKARLVYENGYLKKSILANGTEKVYERIGDKLDKVMIINSNNPVNDKTLKRNIDGFFNVIRN